MDHLWTPWRYSYINQPEGEKQRQGVPPELDAWPGDMHCVFCNLIAAADYAEAHGMPAEEAERAAHIVLRGQGCFICLNAYPYTSGHVMVIPYEHEPSLAALAPETAREMMDLSQQTVRVLERLYSPHGINLGMNLGKAAGAGVAGHLHLHALPRWQGDTNFMTVIGEARVLPETLDTTWEKMRAGFLASEDR
ncbi:MAG TPA: HIT domain-containing protein [Acidisarcina sp.]|nr:HIT domain-containing protein [Acidisarcina sp.]